MTNIKSKVNETLSVTSMVYSGINNLKKFYNFIYNDANFFLKRKKSKFEEGFLCHENSKIEYVYEKKRHAVMMKSPQGKIFPVQNVLNFCDFAGISKRSYYLIITGRYKSIKGWTLESISTKYE